MLTEAHRQYHALYESQSHQRLYLAPWWLDAVCGKTGWDVVNFIEPDSRCQAALPFFKTRIRGLTAITTPPVTQWVEVLRPPESGVTPVLSVLDALPRCSILDLSLRPGTDMQFRSPAYSVSTQYSYILQHQGSSVPFSSGYSEGLRRNLRATASRYNLIEKEDILLLQQLYELVYHQKKVNPPWWIADILPGLVRALLKKQCGKLTFVQHNRDTIAASLTAWDDTHDYYLIGGRIAGEDGVSAHALLLDKAIDEASHRGHDFDFEGSMVPGIAQFFQTFGASPVPYPRVRKFSGMGLLWSFFR
jgi:hypothetical protein